MDLRPLIYLVLAVLILAVQVALLSVWRRQVWGLLLVAATITAAVVMASRNYHFISDGRILTVMAAGLLLALVVPVNERILSMLNGAEILDGLRLGGDDTPSPKAGASRWRGRGGF